MAFNAAAYHPGDTVVHRADAGVKIALLLAYSAALLAIGDWVLLALFAVALCAGWLAARLSVARAARQLVPVWVMMAVALATQSITFDVTGAEGPVLVVAGGIGLTLVGFVGGLFYAGRIVLLVFASVLLTATTSSTEIEQALEGWLSPLARRGLPAQDAVAVVSVALRFIPIATTAFQGLRAAQASRCASFDFGGPAMRMKTWCAVMVPWLVSLYRRADRLAVALDARCYGAAGRTALRRSASSTKSCAIVGVLGVLCILVGVLL